MATVEQLIPRIKDYLDTQIQSMSSGNPMISFLKPLISRALDKKISNLRSALDLIADANGNIDIENILEEMIGSVMSTDPFTINAPIVGNIDIGGGEIRFNLPMTSKKLVFNHSDLESFKETLISK